MLRWHRLFVGRQNSYRQGKQLLMATRREKNRELDARARRRRDGKVGAFESWFVCVSWIR
jgi:hypothetical protein